MYLNDYSGGACTDKVANCDSYARSVCTDPQYSEWVTDNCCAFCSGVSSSGNACTDALSNCADYTLSVCSNAGYAMWVTTNCAKFCGKCSSSSGGGAPPLPGMTSHTGSCQDTHTNCADYGASVCTNAVYATWVTQNCAKFCNKCGVVNTRGSTITEGCVYNGNVYQQGQTWKDACKYTCSCVDGASGKYQCQELCLTWNLPSKCYLNPPAPGKCCQTPSCPTGYNIQYPPGYVAN
ncbi:CCN family member 4-like [Mya arenaria]|uniref:CCN family member 4-like n=1 Tax=Mya arenaria TaxID=6604 RepID=UPI0022E5A869|nr:CCN family member 4-like [Mya arenaria]